MKRSNLDKENYKLDSLRRKGATGSVMELKPVLKYKEGPDIKRNKGGQAEAGKETVSSRTDVSVTQHGSRFIVKNTRKGL